MTVAVTSESIAQQANLLVQSCGQAASQNRPSSLGGCLMHAMFASQCLTRIVVDDRTVELVQLRAVLERIQQVLPRIPAAEREYITNALLNLAVAAVGKPSDARKLPR